MLWPSGFVDVRESSGWRTTTQHVGAYLDNDGRNISGPANPELRLVEGDHFRVYRLAVGPSDRTLHPSGPVPGPTGIN